MSIKVEYIKNIFFSFSNKMWLILFGFLYTFIIANFLGPEKYGIINYYNSFTLGLPGIFGIIFLQGLISVFIPQNKSRLFFEKAIKIQLAIAIFLFLSLFIGAERIAGVLGKSNYEYLRLASLLLLIMPLYDSMKYLYQGFKRFGMILKASMIVNILNLVLAIVLVIVFGFDIFGVIYATIAATVIGIFFFLRYFNTLPFVDSGIDYPAIKGYSKGALLAGLAYRFNGQAFTILVGLFIAEKELGLYYIAYKIASIPITTPALAMREVLFPHIGDARENKDLVIKYASKSIKASIIASVLLGIMVGLTARPILSLLFPLYVDAHLLILLLVPAFIIGLIFNILAPIYAGLNKMDLFAKVNLAGLFSTIIFGWFLISQYDVFGIAATLLLQSVITSGYALHNLTNLGLQIDIVPRREDIRYFTRSIWDTLRRVIQ